MNLAFRTLLFDLDGTLIDSEELILSSYRHTMAVHLGHVPPADVWKESMGRPLIVQLEAFARSAEELRAMERTYTEHNLANHRDLVRPFPGIGSLMQRLRALGVRMGIVTSKRARATRMGLQLCGIHEGWFSAIIAADDVTRYKPDPQPVRKALQALGEEEPRRALFIGDSPHDIRAGSGAGTRTGAALWGPYSRAQLEPACPDYWVATPEAVWEIIETA